MKLYRLIAVLALLPLYACTPTWVESQYQQTERFAPWVETQSTEYRIQPGDELSVFLPFNAELNHKAPVSPDGTFAMPLTGAISAAGHSTTQIAASINQTLATNGMVSNANAAVSVTRFASNVYVGGQVGQPGEIPLRPGMSVMQAIIAARGMRETARTDEVVLIRRSPDGRPMLRTLNINALTRRGDPAQEVALQASDTVFVPQSTVAEVGQWVNQHINQMLPFNKSINYTYSNGRTSD